MTDAQPADDELDRKAPPLWRVWRVARANLIALILVVIAYGLVAWLIVHQAHDQDSKTSREGRERRAGICEAVADKAPDALARAFGQPTDSPELDAYKADLRATLGFCEEPTP